VAEQSLEIDTELLAAGAARCGDAAGMAVGGAKKLADKSHRQGFSATSLRRMRFTMLCRPRIKDMSSN